MEIMFVIGVLLAFGFGITSGILYAQHQRSIFTKNFAENLQKIVKKHEEIIRKNQEKDMLFVENLQKEIQKNLETALVSTIPIPPKENFN